MSVYLYSSCVIRLLEQATRPIMKGRKVRGTKNSKKNQKTRLAKVLVVLVLAVVITKLARLKKRFQAKGKKEAAHLCVVVGEKTVDHGTRS